MNKMVREMFDVETCEGCGYETFDFDSEYYYCSRHNSTLGGDKNNHPVRLLFCSEFVEKGR